jgi:hypothetical protein
LSHESHCSDSCSFFFETGKEECLWAVVGDAFCAPSKELWDTRSVRVP